MYDAGTLSGWQHMRLALNFGVAGLLLLLLAACASPFGMSSSWTYNPRTNECERASFGMSEEECRRQVVSAATPTFLAKSQVQATASPLPNPSTDLKAATPEEAVRLHMEFLNTKQYEKAFALLNNRAKRQYGTYDEYLENRRKLPYTSIAVHNLTTQYEGEYKAVVSGTMVVETNQDGKTEHRESQFGLHTIFDDGGWKIGRADDE
jgi:hypothetical protein